MTPEILLVSSTTVNFEELTASIYRGTGLSLTAKIDASPLKFSNDAKYLIELSEFESSDNRAAFEKLKDANGLGKFLHYTFLIVSDPKVSEELRWHGQVTCISRETKETGIWTLATGTLCEWLATTIAGTRDLKGYTSDYRLLINKLITKFESLGLGALWHEFQKVPHSSKDKTFLLEYKK